MYKLFTQQKHSGSFFPLLWQPIRGLKTRGRWGENGPAYPMAPPIPPLATTRQEQHACRCLSHTLSYSFILLLVLGFTLFPAGYTLTLSILLFFLYSQSAKLQTEYHLSERLVVKQMQAWASCLAGQRWFEVALRLAGRKHT